VPAKPAPYFYRGAAAWRLPLTGMPQCHGSTSCQPTVLDALLPDTGVGGCHHAPLGCILAVLLGNLQISPPTQPRQCICGRYAAPWMAAATLGLGGTAAGGLPIGGACNTRLHAFLAVPRCQPLGTSTPCLLAPAAGDECTPCVRVPGSFCCASIGPPESQLWGGSNGVCPRNVRCTGHGVKAPVSMCQQSCARARAPPGNRVPGSAPNLSPPCSCSLQASKRGLGWLVGVCESSHAVLLGLRPGSQSSGR
jgi:hypothetical protein